MAYTPSGQSTANFTIELPLNLLHQVDEIAQRQGDTLSKIVRFALELYVKIHSRTTELDTNAQDLTQARNLMRTFSQGLGSGPSPHDAARNHDAYLYS